MPITHWQISVVIDGRSIVEAYTKRRLPPDLSNSPPTGSYGTHFVRILSRQFGSVDGIGGPNRPPVRLEWFGCAPAHSTKVVKPSAGPKKRRHPQGHLHARPTCASKAVRWYCHSHTLADPACRCTNYDGRRTLTLVQL